jgi:hypothetical protein
VPPKRLFFYTENGGCSCLRNVYSSTLKMEVAGASETFIIIYQTTRHHIFFYPEDAKCTLLLHGGAISQERVRPVLTKTIATSRHEAKQFSFCLTSHMSLEFPACITTECTISMEPYITQALRLLFVADVIDGNEWVQTCELYSVGWRSQSNRSCWNVRRTE